MPLREYQCCNRLVERYEPATVVARAKPEPPVCDTCGQSMRRTTSTAAVHFKGAGFYHNDYGAGKDRRE